MTTTSVLITNPGDEVYEDTVNIYGLIWQRRDGVLASYYPINDSGVRKTGISYSYDLGETWEQVKLSVTGHNNNHLHTIFYPNFEVHHFMNSYHKKSFPCDTLFDDTNHGNYVVRASLIDSSSNIHLMVEGNPDSANLYYTKFDGNSWTTPDLVANSQWTGFASVDMCMDSNGKIHVFFTNNQVTLERPSNNAYYTNNVSGSWLSLVTVYSNTPYADSPSIVCDDNDDIHIAYSIGVISGFATVEGYIAYGKWNGTSFDQQTLIQVSNEIASRPVITRNENQELYIVYEKNFSTEISTYNIFLLKSADSGDTWSEPEQITNATSGNGFSRLDLFKKEKNYPGDNVPNSGMAGVYRDRTSGELYYFYTSDISYKYPVTGSPTFCYNQEVLATSACVNIAATQFEGLEHLNGETVAILADGVVQDQQVVSGGMISLPASAGVVHVGLPYYSDLETLNIELGSDRDTAQGRKIKVGNVDMFFVDSRGGWIGESFDDLYEAFTNLVVTRNQTELSFNEDLSTTNASTVLYTGHLRKPLGARWRNGGRVCYRQKDPLPVTIGSITPEVAVGGPI